MRVVAGHLGGRPLSAPKGTLTRPTSERVREALFSILGDVEGFRVLDLYAGSGALGIEALSHGAQQVTFVEADRTALAILGRNLGRLGLDDGRSAVLAMRVNRAARAIAVRAPYDLVLCDPPWNDLHRELRVLARLDWVGLLAERSTVVIEHPTQQPPDWSSPPGLVPTACRSWGDTAMTFCCGVTGDSADGKGGKHRRYSHGSAL
ncbi:16S rRNA (guanine(966)-N(2))-methyltransferase RsmD [Myxococcota bacterium]